MTFTRDPLGMGGRVGHDLVDVDWSQTALGPPDHWPASLRNAVRILLTSKFSMWMAWGPELTFFCNDAYRHDTLGKKYPWALGRPASQVWAEIWEDIGPRIDRVLQTGEATWDESLMLFLERSGYLEETYHTFSYSPLADDDGRTSGLLCVVKEDTDQVIAARRMATLRDLGQRTTELDEAQSLESAAQRLAANSRSLPFTAIYLFDDTTGTATLAATSGIDPGHRAAPATVGWDDDDPVWPVAGARAGETVVVGGLGSRFTDLPIGPWGDPPSTALVVPLLQPAQTTPYGVLVAALNPYRALDAAYESFVQLVAAQIASMITDARAYEFERRRAESLAQIDQAKTDFFTNVSHEFRTPLTLLLGPVEEALADTTHPLGPEQRVRMEVVEHNAHRLLKLVNSLLDFSQLESGTAAAHFDPIDLARYTRELASMFESAAQSAGLALVVDCPELPTPVYVDQEHWAKIVLNLMSNALKFTFEGGITVALRAEDEAAVLTVTDTGTGIPEADLPLLFERFHRVHGARSRTREGSGIGLALVAELAALHGGSVVAQSRVGRGTTFTVRIPFGTAHLPVEQVGASDELPDATSQARRFVAEAMRWLQARSDPATTAAEAPGPGVGADSPRILVVDDNRDMREYVAGLLSERHVVETAVDGADALARLTSFRPDLVLTDVMMPNLDGFGLLQRLHADPTTAGIPVIMLSARAGDEGVVEGLEAGADDYLVKPFSARELLARVRVNLELDRIRRVQSTLERSQELLDQAQRLAKLGSWEVDLDADAVRGSQEYLRILEVTQEDLEGRGYLRLVQSLIHPEDQQAVDEALRRAVPGSVTEFEARLRTPAGNDKIIQVRGEVVADPESEHRLLRGSLQDITEQRRLEQAVAAAAASEQAAAREHAIAEELQRSLLPERTYDLEQLDVATYYRAGVEGTHVGGDWYDVIELGAGRVALVIGDVMGRGVSAASVMGQVRSSIRTLAKLDVSPAELIDQLDGFVRDLEADQLVTCVFAVFDSADRTLRYANAGHVPPILQTPDGQTIRLPAGAPPLGAGAYPIDTEEVQLPPDARVTFYTDGLVERRGEDIEDGLAALEGQLHGLGEAPVATLPQALVAALKPEGPDDDVALLVIDVNKGPLHPAVTHRLTDEEPVIANARQFVAGHLHAWDVPEATVDDVTLTASELVTNAFLHGSPPIDVRLVHTGTQILLEVHDRSRRRPRRRKAAPGDEHGRGLQVVQAVADAWGMRMVGGRKSVWCTHTLRTSGSEGGDRGRENMSRRHQRVGRPVQQIRPMPRPGE